MPPPFNSLTLNYSGWPGSEWCGGMPREGVRAVLCVYTRLLLPENKKRNIKEKEEISNSEFHPNHPVLVVFATSSIRQLYKAIQTSRSRFGRKHYSI